MSDQMDGMEVNAAHVPPAPPSCPGGQLYTVRAGDTMFQIAQRFGISLQRLIDANPQITNPNLIFPGQVICIPTGIPPCPTGFTYTVMPGDTLFGIARRLGVTLDSLLRLNPQITDPDRLIVGQVICVPLPVPPAICTGEYYIVRRGDTLSAIAQRYNVSIQELLRANPQITDPNLIYAGQVICIPRRMVAPVPAPTPPVPERPVPLPVPCPPPAPMPRPVPCPPPRPAPAPDPCPPVTPLPYPCPGPIFYVPPVRWEDCPYAPPRRRPMWRRFRLI